MGIDRRIVKQLTLLVGPPGSGKSTYAKNLIENDGDHGAATVRISQDDQGKNEHLVLFISAIAYNKNVIVDRMNFNKGQRNKYLDIAKKAGYHTKIIVLHEAESICLERCIKRQYQPTIKNEDTAKKALNTFFSKYERYNA